MKSKTMLTLASATMALTAVACTAASAEDKYSLKVPGGLAFSEFRGYEHWQVVAAQPDRRPVPAQGDRRQSRGDGGLSGWHSRQRQAFPRWFQACEDRVEDPKSRSAPVPYDVKVPDTAV